MTLSKKTDLGSVSLSDVVFAQIIAESFAIEANEGRVWPATKRGRQIGNDNRFNMSDFGSNIEAETSFDGEGFDLEFNIIVKFGTSIRQLTDRICEYIVSRSEEIFGRKPEHIKIRITGVKSKQIAKRNLEVIKTYGTDR